MGSSWAAKSDFSVQSSLVNESRSDPESSLPPEARQPFAELKRVLHAVAPLNGEGPVRATVRKMSDLEAGGFAGRIVGMLGDLARLQAAQRAPKLRAVGED